MYTHFFCVFKCYSGCVQYQSAVQATCERVIETSLLGTTQTSIVKWHVQRHLVNGCYIQLHNNFVQYRIPREIAGLSIRASYQLQPIRRRYLYSTFYLNATFSICLYNQFGSVFSIDKHKNTLYRCIAGKQCVTAMPIGAICMNK